MAGGSVSASFLYDAEGNRVKGTVAGITTVYLAGLYEWQNGAVTKYYEGGAMRRTGYATDNGVFYVVSDHLRSTSVLVNRDGTVKSRNFYYPYGGNRSGSAFNGITTKRFTGQYHEQGLPGGEGLAFYNARWYDAQVAVFVSADPLVPGPGDPRTFNRYAYVSGNPLRYQDPSGHYACEDDCDRIQFTPKGYTYYSPSTYPNYYSTPIGRVIRRVASGGPVSGVQRMRQVLRQTQGLPMLSGRVQRFGGGLLRSNFAGIGAEKGDAGFAKEFQDDIWYRTWRPSEPSPQSTQVGHFLTAVNMGMRGDWLPTIIAHEQYSDKRLGIIVQAGIAALKRLNYDPKQDRDAFHEAMAADASGDLAARDVALRRILDPSRYGPLDTRVGNSMEDLRLSVRGYRLGLMVNSQGFATNVDLAEWLAANVASAPGR